MGFDYPVCGNKLETEKFNDNIVQGDTEKVAERWFLHLLSLSSPCIDYKEPKANLTRISLADVLKTLRLMPSSGGSLE